MAPRKSKKQLSSPFVSESDSAEYIESRSSDVESEMSNTSGEAPSDTYISITPSKPRTRGRVTEPPVTPTPKKKTANVIEPPVTPTPKGTKRLIITSNLQESPTKKQRTSTKNDEKGKNKSNDVQAEDDVVYIEDLDPETKLPILKTCGVFNKASVDSMLKKTYSKLPMLPGGKRLLGWTGAGQPSIEKGFVLFSSIKEVHPSADMSYLRDLLCFDADKSVNVVNLCRADPTLLCLKVLGGLGSSYICYRGSMAPSRCLVMGLVYEDRTRSAYQLSTGKWMKSISLMPFSLEADRMISAIAVIYDTDDFHGQILNGNILSFTTRQGLLDSSRASSSSPKTKRCRFAKPTSVVGNVSSQSALMGVRGPEDDIPVLDARQKKLELPNNIKNIVDTFPRFSGTVPPDSVVLACFTTSKYMKNNNIYASFNIQWAAVLCGEDA